MGLFSSSKTTVTQTTQNIADAYNTTQSRSDVVADSGNTTVNLGGGNSSAGNWQKYMPIVALICFGLAVLLLLSGSGSKKPWASSSTM